MPDDESDLENMALAEHDCPSPDSSIGDLDGNTGERQQQ